MVPVKASSDSCALKLKGENRNMANVNTTMSLRSPEGAKQSPPTD